MPAYYARNIIEFLGDSDAAIVGTLAAANANANFLQLESAAILAWHRQLEDLRGAIRSVSQQLPASSAWGLLLEFPIPRRQRRIDAVLLAGQTIFVLEFKTGHADASALRQVEDYALDLADFHAPSRNATLIPLVIASKALSQPSNCDSNSRVRRPSAIDPSGLAGALINSILCNPDTSGQIELTAWNQGVYRPVPTIVEAATAIFSGMEVREIAHSHAEAHNLTLTVESLFQTIKHATAENRKIICFVTGVPGSGKTLAGLRAVHDVRIREMFNTDPSFLSGNGPLVKILREALARDFTRRLNQNKADVRRKITTLIQNVHVFAKYYWEESPSSVPHENIIVFDEAQRAWSAEKNEKKFKRNISEPAMILNIMDRHPDWAVIIALVGGGQEIHDGEAGLEEWGRALQGGFQHWEVVSSPEGLAGGASVAGSKLFEHGTTSEIVVRRAPEMHLQVSTRSYKAVEITAWSNALLNGDINGAREAVSGANSFPVVLTRDLIKAKRWLRDQTRGMARCGLVASSGATRLRAYGIETSTGFHRDYPYEYWFLNDCDDVRSSFQLEVVATEFEIQGLELDWIGLCWGGDLQWGGVTEKWCYRRFIGTCWRKIKEPTNCGYLVNSYRVLLTRARQGMVIWIPPGDALDPTLNPVGLDNTAKILRESGLSSLD